MPIPRKPRTMRRILGAVVALLIVWFVWTLSRQAYGQTNAMPHSVQAAPVQRVELSIGPYRILAELANTPERRSRGLMYRTQLALNEGMLFIFDQTDRHCMWMKNTPLPLTVAFLDTKGRIINFADMTPFSEVAHCAAKPARYAIEMRKGWFEEKTIQIGQAVNGLPE